MRKPKRREIIISNNTVFRIIAIIIVSLMAIKFFSRITHPLSLVFFALFLSLALNPAVGWIAAKLRLKSRAAATGVAYFVVLVVLGSFISWVVPPLVKQTAEFIRSAPQTISELKDENTSTGKIVQKYNLEEQIDGLSQNIKDRTNNLQQPVISTASKVGSALVSVLTVLVLTFMMLVEGPLWIKKFWLLHPKERREHDQELARRMYRIVTGYVNGQVLLALLVSLLSLVVLLISSTLLDVSINAVALAGIMFFTGLIPMIGSLIGAAIVVTACLFVSVPLAIIIAVFILVYQQIENITLQPYIQAKFNELTPLLVFLAALLGIGFGGLFGAFIAIPTAGCVKLLIQDYIKQRKLEQSD